MGFIGVLLEAFIVGLIVFLITGSTAIAMVWAGWSIAIALALSLLLNVLGVR